MFKRFLLIFINTCFIFNFISTPAYSNVEENSSQHSDETWAIIDQHGNISNIISCTNDVCGNPESDWSKAVLQDGQKVVKQTDNYAGGYFGQYEFETETFVIDKRCRNCDTWDNVLVPGTIKNGVITQPILKALNDDYEYLSSLNTPSVYQAASLINISFEINRAVNLSTTISLPANLKKISKKTKTPKICKISNKKIFILKSGKCKIQIFKNNKNKMISFKVKK